MRQVQSQELDLGHPYPGRCSAETAFVRSHAGYLTGPAAAADVLADYNPVHQEGNSRLAPAGVMMSVGEMETVGDMFTVGEISGVSAGRAGPMIGSVASGVGVAGGSVGRGISDAVGSRAGVKVAGCAGSGAGREGRATSTRLNTMLATMSMLTSHRIFWLRLGFWRLRLLTKLNLLEICPCDYTTSWQTRPGRCHAYSFEPINSRCSPRSSPGQP
jgi:hypothetical protein